MPTFLAPPTARATRPQIAARSALVPSPRHLWRRTIINQLFQIGRELYQVSSLLPSRSASAIT